MTLSNPIDVVRVRARRLSGAEHGRPPRRGPAMPLGGMSLFGWKTAAQYAQLSTAIHRKRKEPKEKEERPTTTIPSSRRHGPALFGAHLWIGICWVPRPTAGIQPPGEGGGARPG